MDFRDRLREWERRTDQHSDLLRIDEVMRRTGLPRSSVYALIKTEEFPRQIRISPMRSAWDSLEVDAWIQSKLALRERAVA